MCAINIFIKSIFLRNEDSTASKIMKSSKLLKIIMENSKNVFMVTFKVMAD